MLNTVSNRPAQERTLGVTLIVRACLCMSIIVLGLALRTFGFGLGLPSFVVKYGGSALWATMVFFPVAMTGSNLSRGRIASIAASIAVGVELFRLVHTPWLNDFRLTMAGALLLGRIFSPWNVLAYGVGIIFGMLLDRFGSQTPQKQDAPHSAS